MVTYNTGQVRATYWTGTKWQENVLGASGVEVDNTNLIAVTGSTVQALLDAIDNTLSGIEYSTASGMVEISDVANVSGVSAGTLGNLDVLDMPNSANSAFRFSFTVGAQPANGTPVHIRVLYAIRGASAGNLKLNLEYNLRDSGDDLAGTSFAGLKSETLPVPSGSTDDLRLLSFAVSGSEFATAGSAPFIFDGKITRDVSVDSNVAHNCSIVALYADNIPGAVMGNTAGYIGGNLHVTGNLLVDGDTTVAEDLIVSGTTIIAGGSVPASGTAAGVQGSIVVAGNFLYVATGTNTWRRVSLANFA